MGLSESKVDFDKALGGTSILPSKTIRQISTDGFTVFSCWIVHSSGVWTLVVTGRVGQHGSRTSGGAAAAGCGCRWGVFLTLCPWSLDLS